MHSAQHRESWMCLFQWQNWTTLGLSHHVKSKAALMSFPLISMNCFYLMAFTPRGGTFKHHQSKMTSWWRKLTQTSEVIRWTTKGRRQTTKKMTEFDTTELYLNLIQVHCLYRVYLQEQKSWKGKKTGKKTPLDTAEVLAKSIYRFVFY